MEKNNEKIIKEKFVIMKVMNNYNDLRNRRKRCK